MLMHPQHQIMAATQKMVNRSEPTWYTGPTWPRNVAKNVPLTPSHSLMDLSKLPLRSHMPSGLNTTWLMSCTCPVMRASGALLVEGVHRNKVWSSLPLTSRSGCPLVIAS